jgi:hypothetical protein
MNGYREFWNNLIYDNPYLFPSSLERYWTTIIVFTAICFLVGVASLRFRIAAPVTTIVLFLAYVAALVPFMIWTASCSACGASFEGELIRSGELYYLHLSWGGFFGMGIASLWVGVVLSRTAAALIDWRRKSRARYDAAKESRS